MVVWVVFFRDSALWNTGVAGTAACNGLELFSTDSAARLANLVQFSRRPAITLDFD